MGNCMNQRAKQIRPAADEPSPMQGKVVLCFSPKSIEPDEVEHWIFTGVHPAATQNKGLPPKHIRCHLRLPHLPQIYTAPSVPPAHRWDAAPSVPCKKSPTSGKAGHGGFCTSSGYLSNDGLNA